MTSSKPVYHDPTENALKWRWNCLILAFRGRISKCRKSWSKFARNGKLRLGFQVLDLAFEILDLGFRVFQSGLRGFGSGLRGFGFGLPSFGFGLRGFVSRLRGFGFGRFNAWVRLRFFRLGFHRQNQYIAIQPKMLPCVVENARFEHFWNSFQNGKKSWLELVRNNVS